MRGRHKLTESQKIDKQTEEQTEEQTDNWKKGRHQEGRPFGLRPASLLWRKVCGGESVPPRPTEVCRVVVEKGQPWLTLLWCIWWSWHWCRVHCYCLSADENRFVRGERHACILASGGPCGWTADPFVGVPDGCCARVPSASEEHPQSGQKQGKWVNMYRAQGQWLKWKQKQRKWFNKVGTTCIRWQPSVLFPDVNYMH